MKKLFIFLFFLPMTVFSEEYIIVKESWGEVNIIKPNSIDPIEKYWPLEINDTILLISVNSKVWLRDHKDNTVIIKFNETNSKNKYSYSDIKNLLNNKTNNKTREESLIDKFLSLMAPTEKNNSPEINGMYLSAKNGVSRSIITTDDIIYLEDILVYEGLSFKVDFTDFVLDTNVKTYNILIRENLKTLFDFTTSVPSFEVDGVDVVSDLSLEWKLNIIGHNEKLNISAFITSVHVSKKKADKLMMLKEMAFEEIKSEESFYQIIFIEVLKSWGLMVNAKYYEDFFLN